jgi:hypothetical protein
VASVPLADVVPLSLPMASAWGAAAPARPATEAATAAVAHSFFVFVPFEKADSGEELRDRQLFGVVEVAGAAPIGPAQSDHGKRRPRVPWA